MSIAITEDHRSLAETVRSFAEKRNLRAAARKRLESPDDSLPDFWVELAELGWLGLHLAEDVGGSGYGIEELVIVVEELARAVAAGPYVPTVIASAVIAQAGDADLRSRVLPGLADGSLVGAVALGGSVTVSDGVASGDAGAVLGAGGASLLLVPVGDDVAVVDVEGEGVEIRTRPSLDPTRRSAQVTLDRASVTVITGARRSLIDLARVVLAADAVGVARECTEMGAAYSKERIQFGRPIAMYQAVKHHCANMAVATELATSAVWDAARASATGGDQLSVAAAVAATLAAPAADLCANLNTQVHGGIAITWEHDAHLVFKRLHSLAAISKATA
jgi:3-oxochol-4-en-24-oyl-CoA dehydrogenase